MGFFFRPVAWSIGFAFLTFMAGTVGMTSDILPDPLQMHFHKVEEVVRIENLHALMMNVCIWLAWAWVLSTLAAAYFIRWRALWLLLTVPVALFWPLVGIASYKCGLLGGCEWVTYFTGTLIPNAK